MFSEFGVASVASITIICYLIGMWCKSSTIVKDNTIPPIMGLCGAVLGIVGYFIGMTDFASFDIMTSVAVGIVSGLAATGVNQIFKQAQKED